MRINLAWPVVAVGCLAVVALAFLTSAVFGSAATGIVVGMVLLVVGLLFAQSRWDGRDPEATAAAEQHVEEVLTRVLTEEVEELSAAAERLPRDGAYPTPYDDARVVLDPLWGSLDPDIRRRSISPGDEDITSVVRQVADARHRLRDLLGADTGGPRRSLGPCFADPRHGSAQARSSITLSDRSTLDAPLCAECGQRAEVGLTPVFRMIDDGKPTPYWELGAVSQAYINGYWGSDHTFPLRRVQLERHLDLVTASQLHDGDQRTRFYFNLSANSREGNRRHHL